jgi:acyl-CoA synthetase (AMP-forming)/AMP-acid ligase II
MPTSPTFIIILLSALRAGLIPALANPTYTAKELGHVLKLVRAKLVLAHSSIVNGALKEVDFPQNDILDVTWPSLSSSGNSSLWQAKEDDLESAIKIVEKSRHSDWKQTAAIFFR